MEFGKISNLLFYIILPLLIFIIIMGVKKRERVYTLLNFNHKKTIAKHRYILIIMGIILIIFSLLEPKIFKGIEKIDKKGLDIYVLIDVSKSMDTQDIKPSRLERAKGNIREIIDNLKGDRIGYIPFSSDAYIQMPPTEDYDVAKVFLESVATDMIGSGGTSIGKALNFAAGSFSKSSTSDKVIIVMSDGEDHDSTNDFNFEKNAGIKIYTVGYGTEAGGLVPEYNNGTIEGYKKDKSGNFIVSKLNTTTLKNIAQRSNGKYFEATVRGGEAEDIVKDINFLKRGHLGTENVKKYDHIYQIFLALGIILFLAGYFTPRKKM